MDPYAAGMFDGNPYRLKQNILGRLVVILDGQLEDRGLELIKPISRAVLRHEIHELILTDEDCGPGSRVNRIAYLGFFEVDQGGVLVTGDRLLINGQEAGTLAGFDATHHPNHWNIILRTQELKSGFVRGLGLGKEVIFSPANSA